MARINRQWVLRQRPRGLVKPGDLELVESPVPALNESEVLVRTIYLSLDPTNRTWMNDAEGYLPPDSGVTMSPTRNRLDRLSSTTPRVRPRITPPSGTGGR